MRRLFSLAPRLSYFPRCLLPLSHWEHQYLRHHLYSLLSRQLFHSDPYCLLHQDCLYHLIHQNYLPFLPRLLHRNCLRCLQFLPRLIHQSCLQFLHCLLHPWNPVRLHLNYLHPNHLHCFRNPHPLNYRHLLGLPHYPDLQYLRFLPFLLHILPSWLLELPRKWHHLLHSDHRVYILHRLLFHLHSIHPAVSHLHHTLLQYHRYVRLHRSDQNGSYIYLPLHWLSSWHFRPAS